MIIKPTMRAVMGALLVLGLLAPAPALAQQAGQTGTSGQLTMQEVDIRTFIDDVSRATGKTFVVDPRVQGKVTLTARENMSPSELFAIMANVLRSHGYSLTPAGKDEYRVQPVEEAAENAPLVNSTGGEGQMATTVIRLQHADASQAAKLVRPILHSRGKISANPGGNILVVTDFPENLRKARAVVAAMDHEKDELQTVRLHNLTAIDAEDALRNLQGPNPPVSVVAVPANNTLILRGANNDIARIRSLLNSLDASGPAHRGATSIVPLHFASGADLIDILGKLIEGHVREGQPKPTVAYDAGSNTIIINADPETQKSLEEVIRRLDQRRPQVLVEAIIVEISDTAASDIGAQFAFTDPNGSGIPLISSTFANAGGPNVLALTGLQAASDINLSDSSRQILENAAVNSALNSQGGTLGFSSTGADGVFNAILNAVESDSDSNVLSTPFVTTLDNVPATFLVGQEIPITTGETLGSDNTNPFRTFERKEVGIKLDVLPQISEGDVIRLNIKQEVSSIAGPVTTVASDFVTNKRQIETTVLADNSQVIVLGGLLDDDEQISISKVPLLGDVPVVGNIFRSKSTSHVRKNLVVFLRPTIIRTAADVIPLTQARLASARKADMNQSGRDKAKVDEVIQGGK